MVFTSPLMLFGFLALPLLAAIYWLRSRSRERVVSNLAFWIDPRSPRQGGRTLDRLRTPLTFFLELLAIALVVLAAAGPAFVKRDVVRPLMVVLDDSYSMRAKGGDSDSQSVRDRASAALADELRRNRYLARFVLAGAQPRVLGQAISEPEQAAAVLTPWICQSPTADLPAAMGLAAELGGPAARVLVLTDHPPDSELSGGRTEWWAFGEPRPNVAFTAATRTRSGETQRVLLELTNLSESSATAELIVEGADFDQPRRSTLDLAAGAAKRVFLDLSTRSPSLRARLQPDALTLDNEVLLLPVSTKPLRVRVDLSEEDLREAVERALEATGETLRVAERPELVIADHPAAEHDAWRLELLVGEEAVAYTGPFVIDHGHPLTGGISLQNVVWSASPKSDPDGLPIITAGNVPLLTEIEDLSGRRRVQMPFVAKTSTFQNTPDWPIFFTNLIEWRRSGLPGIAAPNARLGQDVAVSLEGTSDRIEILGPEGTRRELKVRGGRLAVPAEHVGLHTVKAADEKYRFACNAVSRDESNLADCESGRWGDWNESTAYQDRRASLSWVFLVMALAAMVGHLALLARTTGGRGV
ncbi:MAG: BatA domain-containing protein [Planctomycetota bacterium]